MMALFTARAIPPFKYWDSAVRHVGYDRVPGYLEDQEGGFVRAKDVW